MILLPLQFEIALGTGIEEFSKYRTLSEQNPDITAPFGSPFATIILLFNGHNLELIDGFSTSFGMLSMTEETRVVYSSLSIGI